MKRLEKIFTLTSIEWKSKDDSDIEQRKKDLPERSKEVQSLLSSIKELMDCSPGVPGGSRSVSDLELNYAKVCSVRDKYEKELNEQFKERQIEQKKAFNKSKLNVKIPQFKCYDSEDMFTRFRASSKRFISTTLLVICYLMSSRITFWKTLLWQLLKIWMTLTRSGLG